MGPPFVFAGSERDIVGIVPGPLGWHTSALHTELQEVIVRPNPFRVVGVDTFIFIILLFGMVEICMHNKSSLISPNIYHFRRK